MVGLRTTSTNGEIQLRSTYVSFGREGEGEERRWSKDGVGRRGSWGLGRETSLARPPRPVGEGAQNNAHKM